MEIKYLVTKDDGVNDYIFIAGEMENNKLNGWGLEEVATTEGIRKTYGRFVDGKLDGVHQLGVDGQIILKVPTQSRHLLCVIVLSD